MPAHDSLLAMLRALPRESRSWEFLWEVNLEYGEAEDREELRQIGLEWLRNASPQHGSCRRVFEPLWEAAEEDGYDELRRIALEWAGEGLNRYLARSGQGGDSIPRFGDPKPLRLHRVYVCLASARSYGLARAEVTWLPRPPSDTVLSQRPGKPADSSVPFGGRATLGRTRASLPCWNLTRADRYHGYIGFSGTSPVPVEVEPIRSRISSNASANW